MTVDCIIQRMQKGEPLRWVSRKVLGRYREGDILERELRIGSTWIKNDDLAIRLIHSGRIREVESEDEDIIDYELI